MMRISTKSKPLYNYSSRRSNDIIISTMVTLLLCLLVTTTTTAAFLVHTKSRTANSARNMATRTRSRLLQAVETSSDTTTSTTAADSLKSDLFDLADQTSRGFDASEAERRRARDIVDRLAALNPTAEPAAAYYDDGITTTTTTTTPTLTGKWTLVYTDAPDITSLRPSPSSPVPTLANLGRIGQECNTGTTGEIKNVIEWLRPDWLSSFGGSNDRSLQKVCCGATASPDRPDEVDLTLVGVDLVDAPLPLLPSNPLEVRGFLTLPFGKFTVLYLDDELRIIRTGQGYLAVNERIRNKEDEWF